MFLEITPRKGIVNVSPVPEGGYESLPREGTRRKDLTSSFREHGLKKNGASRLGKKSW